MSPPVDRGLAVVRSWWPVPALFVAVVVIQAIWTARYDVTGHAAEHLSNAGVVFGITFFVAVIVWALPGRLRTRPELWVLVAVLIGGALIDAIGNVRVVDVIGVDDWTTEQAEQLGALRDGFASAHDLARIGSYVVVVGSVALAAWLWWRRAVHVGVAIGAALLSILVPAWIFPGAGIVVLAIGACVRRARPVPHAGAATITAP